LKTAINRLNLYRGNTRDGYYFHQQNNGKRIKANENQLKTFCSGSEKSRFKIFLELFVRKELTVSFIIF